MFPFVDHTCVTLLYPVKCRSLQPTNTCSLPATSLDYCTSVQCFGIDWRDHNVSSLPFVFRIYVLSACRTCHYPKILTSISCLTAFSLCLGLVQCIFMTVHRQRSVEFCNLHSLSSVVRNSVCMQQMSFGQNWVTFRYTTYYDFVLKFAVKKVSDSLTNIFNVKLSVKQWTSGD